MEQINMGAYRIAATSQGSRRKIPDNFLSAIQASNLSTSWIPPCAIDITSKNIASARWLPKSGSEPSAFYGELVEVRPRDKIGLMNLNIGTSLALPVPTDHAEPTQWPFLIVPSRNLLIIAVKGNGCDSKLSEHLGARIYSWSSSLPLGSVDSGLDAVLIEAIPREENPTKYLRDNPNVGQFEMRIKAKAIDSTYGLFGGLFAGLTDLDKDYLTLRVEIASSKRGGTLPDVSLSTLASVLDSLDQEFVLQAGAKPVVDGRRTRPMKLLNALTEKSVNFDPGVDSVSDLLLEFAKQIDAGEEIELADD